jgi:hypothetical protein
VVFFNVSQVRALIRGLASKDVLINSELIRSLASMDVLSKGALIHFVLMCGLASKLGHVA